MNKPLAVAFSIAILLTVTVVASVDLLQTADATKAKGTTTQKYGSATKSQVCGDKLCSEIDQSESTQNKHGEYPHESKEKMKEKHLQMLEKMKSMNKMEMIDSMKSMMYEHHDMKIEKMSQMDRPKLLEHIEKMLDKMSKDSHDDKDDMYHEDSDEKYKTAEHLAMQHLETFDELDFDVFTNQKWDRLKESHSENIIVHWPDGSQTEGIERHIEDLKAMFVYSPDTRIQEHPVKIASGE